MNGENIITTTNGPEDERAEQQVGLPAVPEPTEEIEPAERTFSDKQVMQSMTKIFSERVPGGFDFGKHGDWNELKDYAEKNMQSCEERAARNLSEGDQASYERMSALQEQFLLVQAVATQMEAGRFEDALYNFGQFFVETEK